jgi:hypothetical protein
MQPVPSDDPDPHREIDLDLTAPAFRRPGTRPARHAPVAVAMLLALLVIAVLTGPTGAAPLAPQWQLATNTPDLWLTSTSVYTVDSSGGGVALVALDVRTGRIRWRRPLTGVLASVYAAPDTLLTTRFPPHPGETARTVVLGPKLGQADLAFPALAMPLAQVTSDLAIVIDRDPTVPAQQDFSALDQAAGLQWTHHVTAIDLSTGATRWTAQLPAGVRWSLPGVRPGASGIAGLSPGQHWMVTSDASGAIAIWDLETGRVVGRRDLGPVAPESYVLALTDAVLVWHRDARGPTAELYNPATLAPQHQFVPALPDAEPVACAPQICLIANGGIAVVDPDGGATSLRLTGTSLRPGPAGRLLVTAFGRPLSIVDINARRVSTVDGWRLVDTGAYTGQAVVVHDSEAPGQTQVGRLDVATMGFTESGWLPQWSPGNLCQADAAHLACADGAVLRVWAW